MFKNNPPLSERQSRDNAHKRITNVTLLCCVLYCKTTRFGNSVPKVGSY